MSAQTDNTNLGLRLLPYLVAGALALLFVAPALRPGTTFGFGDYIIQEYPNFSFSMDSLGAGRLPQWIDGVFGGFPFLSDSQAMVFNPLRLVSALVCPQGGKSAFLDILTLGQILLLWTGVVFLARSAGIGPFGAVLSAVLFSASGFSVYHHSHIGMTQTIGVGLWSTGLLLRAIRRDSLVLCVISGLCYAVAILCGHWQMSLFLAMVAGGGALALGWHIRRLTQTLRYCVVTAGIAVSCAAVQILPTLHLLGEGGRSALAIDEALKNATHWRQLSALWFPCLFQPLFWNLPPDIWFLTTPLNWGLEGAWESSFYLGLAGFAMGFFGYLGTPRRAAARFLLLGSLFFFVMSLGRVGVLYPLAYHMLPGFKQIRFPSRLLWVAFLGWSLLAGMGLDALIARPREQRLVRAAKATIIAVVAIVAIHAAALAIGRMFFPGWADTFRRFFVRCGDPTIFGRYPAAFARDVCHQLVLGGVVALAVSGWLHFAVRSPRARSFAVIAVGLVFCELWCYGFHKNVQDSGWWRARDGRPPLYQSLCDQPAGRVLAADWRMAEENAAMLLGYRYAGGYNPLATNRALAMLPLEQFPCGSRIEERKMDLWNVGRVVVPEVRAKVTLTTGPAEMPITGWVRLEEGDPKKEWASSCVSNLPEPGLLRRVHAVVTAGCAMGGPTGLEVARLDLESTDGTCLRSFPLRLGQEIAEWSYDNPADSYPRAHRRPPPACDLAVVTGGFPGGHFYQASFDATTTAPVASLRLRVAHSAPVFVCLAGYVAEDAHGSFTIGPDSRYRQIPSCQTGVAVVSRETSPGTEAWMVPLAEPISGNKATRRARARALDSSFDPRRSVVIEVETGTDLATIAQNATRPSDYSGRATVARLIPEHVVVETTSSQPGWIVFSQSWYRGWTATLDGRATQLFPANGAILALPVPGGRHRVELQFLTPGLLVGGTLSLAGVFASVVGLAYGLRRRSRGMGGTAQCR